MSSVELLDRIRNVNVLLHQNKKGKVAFSDICGVLHHLLSANVMVISRKGKVLGEDAETTEEGCLLPEVKVGSFLNSALNDRLLGILSMQENVNLQTLGFDQETAGKYHVLVAPIFIAGRRLGTLVVSRISEMYSIEDIIVCEYGTTVVGLEMLRSLSEEDAEENRKEKVVRSAFASLSYSEAKAVVHVLDSLEGKEGTIVASRIAENIGITRSIIVNAMKKLESAGIIETRSAGMRGTNIKIINDDVYDEAHSWQSEMG